MKWKPIIWIAVVAGAGTGAFFLAKYIARQKVLAQDYEADVIAIRSSPLNADLMTLEFTLRLHNKSDIEATVKNLYADVYLNNSIVGNVMNNGQFVIPAKGYSDAKINVNIAPKQILRNAVSALLNLANIQDIPYSVKGYLKIKSGFIGAQVPFTYNGSLRQDMLGK